MRMPKDAFFWRMNESPLVFRCRSSQVPYELQETNLPLQQTRQGEWPRVYTESGIGYSYLMRHLLTFLLLVFVVVAPITSSASARKTTRKNLAHSTTIRKTGKKTERVNGYTNKGGKRVAPYKRRPAR